MVQHNFRQDFIETGKHPFLPYITVIQHYKCRNCGETLVLPDCGKRFCLSLLNYGCKGQPPKEKWKSPMREKVYEEKKTYPAPKAKSRKRGGNGT